ncbi:unnamed protein product [Prorocentrum cordatum]|uniref:Uncharacterized protein n=1 Tax=Prorocentrum cordatum TaxID=2364126 RepID=A0ABN9PGQ9_9DINO|nr:unnamed protein product [Polarella glacialis]
MAAKPVGGRASDGGGPGQAMHGVYDATVDYEDKNDNGEIQGYYVHVSRHQRVTNLSTTWQWFSVDEYDDKFQRDSGIKPPPSHFPACSPPTISPREKCEQWPRISEDGPTVNRYSAGFGACENGELWQGAVHGREIGRF